MEWYKGITRRGFLKATLTGICLSALPSFVLRGKGIASPPSPLFWVKNIPDQPFYGAGNGNYHAGIDYLLQVMGAQGLKFYRSMQENDLSGPGGMIEVNDVVLIKVNAQWKYRGCTNSDLIRGLIQRILDHPDGFSGEVVIIENGQGQGSLNGDALGWGSYPDNSIQANANDESHSFLYLVDTVFGDSRVSAYLLDPIRNNTSVSSSDHVTQGYRIYENISYPCFTTTGGRRVELRDGLWNGNGYTQNLKLINVPVLKYHDTGGSEITASLKHCYGIVSMADGNSGFRHYSGLGETCGKMMVSVQTPVLNIIDAIWVSYSSVSGYPASTTFRANQILASQDPVALDYWAAKYILYPLSQSPRHLPTFSGIDLWLTNACDTINARGGLYNPSKGIQVENVTKTESEMSPQVFAGPFGTVDFNGDGKTDILWRHKTTGELAAWYMNGVSFISPVGIATVDPIWELVGTADLNSDGKADFLWRHKTTGELAAWYMNGVNFISPVGIAMVDPIWELVGTPDLNSDGKADFLWRHKITGELAAWYMNGVNFISPVGIATVDPIWEIVAPK